MGNLGIATPTVRLLSRLPNIASWNKKTNFESSAHNWDSLQKSIFFEPLLIESINNGEFAALHLAKRIHWIDNLIVDGDYEPTPDSTSVKIVWRQRGGEVATGSIMEEIITDFDYYHLIPLSSYAEVNLSDYHGPIWENSSQNKEPDPDDDNIIKKFLEEVDLTDSSPSTPETPTGDSETGDSEEPILPKISWVSQKKAKDGLWWAIESNAFLNHNMPFWVIIKRTMPPSTYDHDTLLVISIGRADPFNRYDIYLSTNQKPKIIDWGNGEEYKLSIKEFDVENSRLWSDDQIQKIAVMTVAGRLVVMVNDYPLIYTRVKKNSDDEFGSLGICEIASGPVILYGTNTQMSINASPMVFSKVGCMAIPVPNIIGEGEGSSAPSYSGMNWRGDPHLSVAHLPTPPSVPSQLYGCDCRYFYGDGGVASPDGDGFHKNGEIKFFQATSSHFPSLPSTNFYALMFKPDTIEWIDGFELNNAGTPYFFRLKGIHEDSTGSTLGGGSVDITNLVVSISENVTAPDFFHCKKTADIVCYDPNGTISSLLIGGQTGVEISWGWNEDNKKTFTGIAISHNMVQTAGMETISIRAEDYFYILKNSPIVNSPFYDGMVAFYAIKDMAERANINSIINMWETPNDYFLPAGFAFSKPAMRYNSNQSLFDCMIDIVKRFEAFLYFDEHGQLVITHLPGGLLSEVTGPTSASFFSDPNNDDDTIILDEKNVEINYDSTVNVISAMTVSRDTRNVILYSKTASGAENNLLFKKVYLLNQSALGELEVCRQHVLQLSQRMFYPILKTRWKTAGTNVSLEPLSFVEVDGKAFRLMSIKRNFNANNNELDTNYEGEWLGGA
jgi:hypothetical protein